MPMNKWKEKKRIAEENWLKMENYNEKYLRGQIQDAVRWYKEIKERQEARLRVNKLSFRRRAMTSPSIEEIKTRERQFVNDAILTEKMRTRYKDIIPVYDASMDKHCMSYFSRPDIKRLLRITCTPETRERKSLNSV